MKQEPRHGSGSVPAAAPPASKPGWSLRKLTLAFFALAALASAMAYATGHDSASARALAAWSGATPERVGLAFGAGLFFPAVAFLLVYKHRDKPLDAPPCNAASGLWLLGALTALCAWPNLVTLAWCCVTTTAAGLPMLDRVASQALGAPVLPTLWSFERPIHPPAPGRTPLRAGPVLTCLALVAFRFPMLFLVFNPGFFPALYANALTDAHAPVVAGGFLAYGNFLLIDLLRRVAFIFKTTVVAWFVYLLLLVFGLQLYLGIWLPADSSTRWGFAVLSIAGAVGLSLWNRYYVRKRLDRFGHQDGEPRP